MKKKLIALFIMVVMVLASVVGLVACDPEENNPNNSTVHPGTDITIWVSEVDNSKTLAETQVARFIAANAQYANYRVTVEGISESKSATDMVTDVATGADIFCFAQDQLARLIQAGALSKIAGTAADQIKNDNDAGAVAAATQNGDIYCFPITSDNGYYMYYDKRVIKEESIGKLESIIEDVVASDTIFAMETDTSAWYMASFFFATGCTSAWTKSEDGTKFASLNDTFNSPEGIIAMKGMHKLTSLGESNYKSSSDGAEFSKNASVVVSGTWAKDAVITNLGEENMGVAKLPTFTVDGKEYQMASYSGNKLMGIKPHNDPLVQSFCQNLAAYLSNEECQMERFDKLGWGPSNKNAQQNEAVQADPLLSALAAQNAFATPQGQIHGGWWDVAKLLGTASQSDDVAEYEKALKKYDDDCKFLLSLTEEQLNAFTVIGTVAGSAWGTDYEMIESPEGTWTSKQAFEFTTELVDNDGNVREGVYGEFKVRKGLSWDTAYGDGTNKGNNEGNYVVEVTGTYKIQLVIDKDGNGTITLVAAE